MDIDRFGASYSFDSISGATRDRCAFLAYRRDAEEITDPQRMESWVVQPTGHFTPDGGRLVGMELGVHGYLSSLWYSPSGRIYVTDFHGRLFVQHADPSTGLPRWMQSDFGRGIELHGVWGLDDMHVYAWGRDAWGPLMWQLAGQRFQPMPAPEGQVLTVRGLAPDCLYAAGANGLLARWDGNHWRSIRIETRRTVTGLTLNGPEEFWLCTDNGKLFEGTSHGWALRLTHPTPLYDVAVWHDDVWIAAGPEGGLLRLVPRKDQLELVAAHLEPIALASADELLAISASRLASTTDGREFSLLCSRTLIDARGEHPPHWR